MAPEGREPTIVMRLHRVRAQVVLAACDADLLERELAAGPNGRRIKVSAHFYGERRVGREEFVWALSQATTANLLGAEVCRVAREEGYIAEGATTTLGGVPHAEIFTIMEP